MPLSRSAPARGLHNGPQRLRALRPNPDRTFMTRTQERFAALRPLAVLAALAAGMLQASPAAAQTTAGGHVALKGTYIEVGVNKDGYFGFPSSEVPSGYHPHSPNGLGFVADYLKNGWTGQYGGDYFTPGTPFEGFYVGWTGSATVLKGNAGGVGAMQISTVSLVDTSAGNSHSAVWTGEAFGDTGEKLKVIQTYSFKTGDLFFTANVQLINTGTATLNAVKFARQVDPDNDQTWTGSFNTVNTVVYQPSGSEKRALVTATGTGVTDMTLGLGTIDARAKVSASIGGGNIDQILNSPVDSVTGDSRIGLAYSLGTLAPGQSTSLDYAYILSASDLGTALGALAAVTIQQPTGTISGSTVPFQVTTDDLAHTSGVEFFVNGTSIGSSTTPSGGVYSTTFDSTLYVNGSLALKAVATINGAPVEKSSTVLVDNSGPPMSFTLPVNGTTVSGTGLTVSVAGSDLMNPPTQVVFYREVSGRATVTLGTVNAAPFQATYDTSDLPEGTAVTLRAVGRNAGGSTTNITVGVITGALSTSTSLALSSSLEPSTAADGLTFTATLSPSSATGTVQFKVDGVALGSPVTVSGGSATSSATYVRGAGSHSITAAFIGTGVYLDSTRAITQHVSAAGAASISFQGDSSQAVVGSLSFPSPITVAVADAWGNPVPGASVSFVPPDTGASATLTLPSAVTDADGLVMVQAAPNTVAGTYHVDVVCESASTYFSLTNAPGPVDQLLATSGDEGQSATVGDVSFPAALGVVALDVYSNPVPGVEVDFSAPPGSGPSAGLSLAAATTDGSGRAAVTAAPGTIAGSYQVTASVGALRVPFGLTNLAGAPYSLVADAGSTPQQARVDQAFASRLGATVYDRYGNVVPHALVRFTAPSSGATASVPAGDLTTDTDGHVEVSATAGTVAGSYPVVAATGNDRSVSFTLTNVCGLPAAVVAVSGGGQHARVETTYAAALVARVADAHGNPVPNVSVAFAAPGSGPTTTLSALALTSDASGLVQVTATPGTAAGAFTVTATAAGVEDSAAFGLTNDPGAPARIAAVPSAATQTAMVGQAFDLPLQVRVQDQYGNPVPGVPIAYGSPASDPTVALSAPEAVTGEDGTAAVTATAGLVSGSYSVFAFLPGGASATFALTNSADEPTQLQVVSGGGAHATVAAPFAAPLVVAVTDRHGRPVRAAAVTFAAPAEGPTAQLGAVTVYTGVDGQAVVSLAAGTVAGEYEVSATCPGAASPAAFTLANDPGAPARLAASPAAATQAAQVGTGLPAPLSVTVLDAYDNPVPGVLVAFTAPASGATAQLGAASATTGADGMAVVNATAGLVTGGYTVSATIDGVASPTDFALTNQLEPPSSLVAVSGGGQSATVATAFGDPLVVSVRDAYGIPVPGATVHFAGPGPGAALPVQDVDTDASGQAQVPVTAGTVAGSYVVTATTAGASAPAQFLLQNTAGAPASLAGDAAAVTQSARAGEAFSSPVGLTVLDGYGNPVPGVTVAFSCPEADATCALDAVTAQTDASGRAAVRATAGEYPGAVDVTAHLGGLQLVFHLTDLAGRPGSIEVTTGAGQQADVLAAFAAPLGVRVKDAYGNVVPGAEVDYEVVVGSGGAGAVLSAASVTTDGTGAAQVTATANGAQGAYQVRASAGGTASPVEFGLTNLALTSTLALDVQFPAFGGDINGHTVGRVHVTVGPAAGDLAPSGTVTLSAPGTIALVPGQTGVTQVGDTITATLVNGVADVQIRVVGWSSRTMEVAYVPDASGAQTWAPASQSVNLATHLASKSSGGGCSCDSGGTGPAALLPFLLLLLLRRRRVR